MPDLADPRTLYATPPFDDQKAIGMPGAAEKMNPAPDHGERGYVGSGKLKGRVALVTGGDSGIGRAVCIAYAKEGANVVVAGFSNPEDGEKTRALCESAGVKASYEQADVQDPAACRDLIDRVIGSLGGLDVLVNNAAYQETRETLDEMEDELFDRIMKTNVYGPFYLSKAALPHLKPGASIITTTSIQGYDPSAALLPYATTKAAMNGMTKALAKLAIKSGVRVNAVAPGPVWTPFIPGSMPLEQVRQFGSSTLFERPAQPIELAPLYVWLASPEASYVTGEVYGATGGKSPV